MNDNVKLLFSISRNNILLLSKIIERGLSVKDQDDKSASILELVTKETLQQLEVIPADLLEKAGLTEMNKKLNAW